MITKKEIKDTIIESLKIITSCPIVKVKVNNGNYFNDYVILIDVKLDNDDQNEHFELQVNNNSSLDFIKGCFWGWWQCKYYLRQQGHYDI